MVSSAYILVTLVISSVFSRCWAICFEVLAMVIAAYSESLPLDVHSYFAQVLSLPDFRHARTSVMEVFSFGQESAAPSSSVPSQR